MSFPIFSQSDTVSEDLICIPTIQAKQIAADLVMYDLCRMERFFITTGNDLSSIVEQNDILITQFKNATDSLMFINRHWLKDDSPIIRTVQRG